MKTIETEQMSAIDLMNHIETLRQQALWIYFKASVNLPRKKKKELRKKCSALYDDCNKKSKELYPAYELELVERQKHLDEIWDRIQVSLADKFQEDAEIDIDTFKENRAHV